jgi:hypothetical protein
VATSFEKNFEIKTKAAGRRLARAFNKPVEKFVPEYDINEKLKRGTELFKSIQQSRSIK